MNVAISSAKQGEDPEQPKPPEASKPRWQRILKAVWKWFWRFLLESLVPLATAVGVWVTFHLTTAQLADQRTQTIGTRLATATSDLGADGPDERFAGVLMLQSLMDDTPGEEPAVTKILANFVRHHLPSVGNRADPAHYSKVQDHATDFPTDVQAALDVLSDRRTHDERNRVDLSYIDLRGMKVVEGSKALNFAADDLTGVELDGDYRGPQNLQGADFSDAILTNANLSGAILAGARLQSVAGVNFGGGVLSGADLDGAVATHAAFTCAILAGTLDPKTKKVLEPPVSVKGADLTNADFTNAGVGAEPQTAVDFSTSSVKGPQGVTHLDIRPKACQ